MQQLCVELKYKIVFKEAFRKYRITHYCRLNVKSSSNIIPFKKNVANMCQGSKEDINICIYFIIDYIILYYTTRTKKFSNEKKNSHTQ